MSSEFMPMALDSLARQQSARAAGSGASSRITEEELEELGIPVNKPPPCLKRRQTKAMSF